MKDFSNVNVGRRRFLRLGVFVSTATWVRGRASEILSTARYFNVPKGDALKSLKLAIKQAKVEFILSADLLKGLETRKIKGKYTPIEAFNRMFSDSHLEVVQHEKSGVYAIKKIPTSKGNSKNSTSAISEPGNAPNE